jgi:hypothetical protein
MSSSQPSFRNLYRVLAAVTVACGVIFFAVFPFRSEPVAAKVVDCTPNARLEFVRYEPSKAEEAWGKRLRTLDAQGEHCPAFMVAPFKEWTQSWITGSLAVQGAKVDISAPAPNFIDAVTAAGAKDAADVFSILRESSLQTCGSETKIRCFIILTGSVIVGYKDTCTGATVSQYVEPLLGIMRDPRPSCFFGRNEENPWTPQQGDVQSKDVSGGAGSLVLQQGLFHLIDEFLCAVQTLIRDPTLFLQVHHQRAATKVTKQVRDTYDSIDCVCARRNYPLRCHRLLRESCCLTWGPRSTLITA